MRADALARLYGRLTPRERFHLVLEAMAREDREEMKRLAEACPRKTYTMADADHMDLLDGSRLAAACFSIFWLDANRRVGHTELGQAAFHLAVRAFEEGFEVGLGAAKHIPRNNHPVWQASEKQIQRYDALREKADQRHRETVAGLKGVYTGFLRFCRAAEVEPEKLLVWYKPVLTEIEEARGLLDGEIPADDEVAEITYQRLCLTWPGLAEKSTVPNPSASQMGVPSCLVKR